MASDNILVLLMVEVLGMMILLFGVYLEALITVPGSHEWLIYVGLLMGVLTTGAGLFSRK
ncbi:hypothetical protein [Halorussus sp. MSC15.2]|uniref:hypothetical protein n=1 Tax=Halorussus sp. MSC15.2 TaxID=2283638 RepID=UPI0013D228E0|nr:hypothetical protein [Halorussus sp. MSC15.2]NEU58866.1 hypothetical protein [Halorussus sp. MSC15.2]